MSKKNRLLLMIQKEQYFIKYKILVKRSTLVLYFFDIILYLYYIISLLYLYLLYYIFKFYIIFILLYFSDISQLPMLRIYLYQSQEL